MSRKGTEGFALGAMNLISNKTEQLINTSLEGITFKQWFLLVMISKMGDGPKNLQDVADFCGTSRQNTKRMLSCLEKNKLCKLAPSPFDARALSVTLTRKGLNTLEKKSDTVNTCVVPLFNVLSEGEMEALVVILQKLLSAVEDSKA